MSDAKQGPLTVSELLSIWESATDPSYNTPFINAGEGGGLEVYTQAFAQFERVSKAIDRSTQQMYIMPFSGQSDIPAQGERFATCTLSFQRTKRLDLPLRLGAGQVFYEEVTNDWGPNGSIPVPTSRRYTLIQDLVFLPGESGPMTALAVAERPGWGYNNPLIGTIKLIDQPGTQFLHNLATVVALSGAVPPLLPPPSLSAEVITVNEADMFVPEHVGQYLLFTAGANAGTVARMISFVSPDSAGTPPVGSSVFIESLCAVEIFTAPPAFASGEQLLIKAGATLVGTGQFVVVRAGGATGHSRLAFVLTSGTISQGNTLTGALSMVVATASVILAHPVFVSEAPPPGSGTGGASWSVLDWSLNLGLTVENLDQPIGGQLGMLDELGYERALPRLKGEIDNDYRLRIHTPADVVTPNAIRRALTRVMGSLPFCFREVGSPLLPGFFFDRVDAGGDFYDYDVLIFNGVVASGTFIDPAAADGWQEQVQFQDSLGNDKAFGYFGRFLIAGTQLVMIRKGGQGTPTSPVTVAAGDKIVGLSSGAVFNVASNVPNSALDSKRFHVWLDYIEMRAFFLVGVPIVSFGEFAFAWAQLPAGSPGSTYGAYDSTPFTTFYDGFPAGNEAFYQRVYQAVDKVRAGGVGFNLYQETGSCS